MSFNDTLNISQKDQEPNPFEQSFSSISAKSESDTYALPAKLNAGVDTWVNDISSYSFNSNASAVNDSYSSVSDYQATTSEDSDDTTFHRTPMYNTMQTHRQPQDQRNSTTASAITTASTESAASLPGKNKSSKKRNRTVRLPEDEEKRKNFLERNRIAALKCRQRKKQWLSNLQARVEYLTNDNDQLEMEANSLRKEIMDLKTLLVAHKNCPQYNAVLTNKKNYEQQPTYHPNFTT
ncbi:hypothetical protein [Parasitella parasitica]|uniref:BZIP domain-containing protein n=1 Tax=Parasitella parasitica TaxID=35722 RepID=A0A0B7N1T2_9FUNG|nr:hypothetical protein [Parasitella parasitica]